MKLYIANCTKQVQDFCYRVPEEPGLKRQTIPIGQQIPLSYDFTKMQIESVIAQHERYGMVHVSQIDLEKGFTGLCYDIDKRVSVESILAGLDHNQTVLIKRGQDIRRKNAISISHEINNQLAESLLPQGIDAQLRELEVTIEEEERAGSIRHEDDNLIEEGTIVTESEVDGKQGMVERSTRPNPRRKR